MMLEQLGEGSAARRIEEAVQWATAEKLESMAAGKMGYSTCEVGDLVAGKIAE